MGIPALRLLTVSREIIGSWWSMPLHADFWRLYLNIDTGAALRHPGGLTPLATDRCWLVPAGCAAHGVCTRTVRHLYAHIHVIGWEASWVARAFPAPLPAPRPAELVDLERELARRPATPADECRVLAAFAGALASHLAGRVPPPIDDGLGPALHQLAAYPGAPARVADLARRCGLGEDAFRAKIAARFGATPARWIREHRVASAAVRLRAGREPIEEVARACGFANRYHFTRAFAAVHGVGPAAWRRKLGAL